MINLKKELIGAKSIAVAGHIRPDGDCIGSNLAMYQYLKKIAPKTEVDLFLEQPSPVFHFLKDMDKIDSEFSKEKIYDIFIALDCGDSARLGDAKKYFLTAKKTICIDHHISNQKFADVNYIEPTASSTCELIFNLIATADMDAEIAKAIFTGIVHDTGVFQYSNTSKKTFEIVGELTTYDFDRTSIIDETFYQKSYVANQILGRALLESFLIMDGKCIVSMVDQKTMDFYQALPRQLDGIVNQLRVTRGVECAIFLYQTGTLEYKVSMRSNHIVDVAKIAGLFGGGGHIRAAGCTMNGTYHDVINNLTSQIEKQLSEFDEK